MKSQCCAVIGAIAVVLATVGCKSPYFADQGAAVGAVTGALAGAALGDRNDNSVGGALLGGTVGALAGSAIGEAMDEKVARSQALIEQRLGQKLSGATTVADVVTLTQAGLSDEVIVTHIQAHGVARAIEVPDLIGLRDAGVSDVVIRAMQSAPLATAAAPPPTPVVVEEHVYVAPPFPRPRFHYHHHAPWRHRRAKPGFHWGVSFSN